MVKHAGLAGARESVRAFIGRTKLTARTDGLRLAAWRAVWGASKRQPGLRGWRGGPRFTTTDPRPHNKN